jgi:preprotein translocase subunit SecA
MSILYKIFGDPNAKVIKEIQPIVEEINKLEPEFSAKTDEEMRAFTEKFKAGYQEAVAKGEDGGKYLDQILPQAFAAAREMSKRVSGQRHFDVQLIGGIVLHRGQIAEMKTGEGKTRVATLPLYLNALTGKGVHLVTVNDYLSRVGAGWMAPLYHSLGLTTSVIVHDNAYFYDPEYSDDSQFDERLRHFKKIPRQEAYACDILYGTNNEFGFDYLKDNMVADLSQMVQRELHFAIVDEVDSILIDEARTPLIISAPAEESTDKYFKFAQLVKNLAENDDYNVDEKMRAATLTEGGITKMEKWLGVENIYVAGGVREVHHIEQALKAQVLFKKDRDYVINNGEIIIVDEFTGRLMPGRRYSEGLHQAIEAKEGVQVQRESMTLATVTFQNYFRMYKKLAGMTGTAVTEAEEFAKIYKLETVVIPTNRQLVRKDLNDLVYKTEEAKFMAVIKDVKERNQKGQPVLVGTISIEKNELLVEMMEREGLRPQVLNAKNHEKEAQIISQAGKPGGITIATNMAGRGVDIILGGNPSEQPEQEKVKALGGLHVIGTERHEARRIDNQLRGRAGRQGDPGSSQFYISMEDDLMRIFGGDRMKSIMTTLKVPDDMPIEYKMISRSIESAQKKVEGNNFDIRKHLVEYDDVINKHREAIYRRRREILENYKLQITNYKQASNTNDQNSKQNDEQSSNSQFPIPNTLTDIIFGMVEGEIEQVVSFHTAAEDIKAWNTQEIFEVANTIFAVDKNLKMDLEKMVEDGSKLDKIRARTKIIEFLIKLAREKYQEMRSGVEALGVNWLEIEKGIMLRSIDTLWVEHLDAMDYMRRGIGLRGYGQRDPLVEYKKEAYLMFTELNNLIQKQIVYSIFKIGIAQETAAEKFSQAGLINNRIQFSAPEKEMKAGASPFASITGGDNSGKAGTIDLVHEKAKNEEGEKVGRNDPCPCGSGKKYKKCCGK